MFLVSKSVRFEPGFLAAWEHTLFSLEVYAVYRCAMERLINAVLTPVSGPWYK